MADGFLSRWAKRKEAVRKGEEVAEEAEKVSPPPSPQPSHAGGRGSELPQPSPADGRGSELPAAGTSAVSPSPLRGEGRGEGRRGADEAPPPPTLQDVESLTPASDFSRFVQPGVDPAVKNAAVKKLWADPRFNIQDGLDVYIDDYGKPDPLSPALLRQLASARFLNLFDDDEDKAKKKAAAVRAAEPAAEPDKDPKAREAADAAPAESVAQSGTAERDSEVPAADQHADPDLRLQQDDAPGRPGPGAGSG